MTRPVFLTVITLGLMSVGTLLGGSVSPATQPDAPTTQPQTAQPDPRLSPSDVVKIQMTAMQHNDEPAKDSGIATVFRFASPGNQQQTGPLPKFIRMVKSPAYAPMIGFKSIDYAPAQLKDDQARQLVKIVDDKGKTEVYLFILSRQKDGDFKDCWMTDGVVRIDPNNPPPPAPGDEPVKT